MFVLLDARCPVTDVRCEHRHCEEVQHVPIVGNEAISVAVISRPCDRHCEARHEPRQSQSKKY